MFKIGITKEKIAENIRELVMKYSRTKTQKETGIPLRTLDNYLSGETEPKLSGAIAIAKALGTSVEYLALREGPEVFDFKDRGEFKAASSLFEGTGIEISVQKRKNPWAEDIYMEVTQKYLSEVTSSFRMFKVLGDSMASYKKGDLLLVDESKNELNDGATFVFSYMNNQLIREVQLVPGEGWLLKTNNPNYKDQLLDLEKYKDEITVMGRVTSAVTFF